MLITADVMQWLNLAAKYNYKRNYYHALLCDPPYHLTSITKRFGKTNSSPVKNGVFRRASRGFMGQAWDGGDLAFNPELWAGLKEVLLPGAFCFSFASSRGWHRMATAIEDAGFIIQPTLFGYGFGCLSEDTEILTQQGWQYFHPCLLNSMVMGYNVDTNIMEWMKVQEVYEYDYNDTAYRIQSDSTDQIVSRNHRCLVKRNGKFIFRQAETLESKEAVPIVETLPTVRTTIFGQRRRPVLEENSLFKTMCYYCWNYKCLWRRFYQKLPYGKTVCQVWRGLFSKELASISQQKTKTLGYYIYYGGINTH